jgi:hypothetical protein
LQNLVEKGALTRIDGSVAFGKSRSLQSDGKVLIKDRDIKRTRTTVVGDEHFCNAVSTISSQVFAANSVIRQRVERTKKKSEDVIPEMDSPIGKGNLREANSYRRIAPQKPHDGPSVNYLQDSKMGLPKMHFSENERHSVYIDLPLVAKAEQQMSSKSTLSVHELTPDLRGLGLASDQSLST